MKVFLLKDVEQFGAAGEMVSASDGYARNFLIPRKLAIEVTPENEASFKNRVKVIENRKSVIATKTSLLAEKIKSAELVLKRKMHDDGKLYGSVSAQEVADLLSQVGISIAKNQVVFDKTIKSKGTYSVIVKLSSKLQPTLMLKVVPQ